MPTILTLNWNGRKIGREAVCAVAVMMTAAVMTYQPAQGVASDAMKSQSTTTSAQSPDEARGDDAQADSDEELYGTWIANDVDTHKGKVKIKLTFRREGVVRILAWSDIPLAGKVKDLKEPYEVDGDTISSKALRGGTKAKYSFEGEHLVLQFETGKVVRFHRE